MKRFRKDAAGVWERDDKSVAFGDVLWMDEFMAPESAELCAMDAAREDVLARAELDPSVDVEAEFAKAVAAVAPRYRLSAIVCHSGSRNSGHYFAFVKDSAGWRPLTHITSSESQHRDPRRP